MLLNTSWTQLIREGGCTHNWWFTISTPTITNASPKWTHSMEQRLGKKWDAVYASTWSNTVIYENSVTFTLFVPQLVPSAQGMCRVRQPFSSTWGLVHHRRLHAGYNAWKTQIHHLDKWQIKSTAFSSKPIWVTIRIIPYMGRSWPQHQRPARTVCSRHSARLATCHLSCRHMSSPPAHPANIHPDPSYTQAEIA